MLIFDEPTATLDKAQADRFFEILRRLKGEGRAHHLHLAPHGRDFCDRRPSDRDARRPRRSATSHRRYDTSAKSSWRPWSEQEELAAAAAAPAVRERRRRGACCGRATWRAERFSDVSLRAVGAGEILGLGGLHGQGQSALLRAHLRRAAGDRRRGRAARTDVLDASSPPEAIRSRLAYVSGDRRGTGCLPCRSILENLMPSLTLRAAPPSGRSAALRRARSTPHARGAASSSSPASARRSIRARGGNQQKVVIGRWLSDEPDSPAARRSDQGHRRRPRRDLFALIRKLAAEGVGIVLYSSEDDELLGNADRVLVFNGGRMSRELRGIERTRTICTTPPTRPLMVSIAASSTGVSRALRPFERFPLLPALIILVLLLVLNGVYAAAQRQFRRHRRAGELPILPLMLRCARADLRGPRRRYRPVGRAPSSRWSMSCVVS